MVGVPGFEPGTSSSRTKRSAKLSYTPRTGGEATSAGPEGEGSTALPASARSDSGERRPRRRESGCMVIIDLRRGREGKPLCRCCCAEG